MSHPIHDQVRKTYTEAIEQTGSCCGGACATPPFYDADMLEGLPDVPSFGCGDPLAFANVGPGEVVVDLGSGAGLDLLVAARQVGPTGRVIGIDMTDAMLAAARANIAKSGLTQVEVRKGLIEKMPVDSDSVDHVISNCVINLSPDKPAVFQEIARVLKPGGQMLVSDIVADVIPEAVRHNPEAYGACIGGAIPEADYLAAMTASGLTDIEIVDRVPYQAPDVSALGLDGQVFSLRVRARLGRA